MSTPPNVNDATGEELFAYAVKAVVKQGRLSRKSGPTEGSQGTCFYRHPDDPAIRCGVGHLIPDEHYHPMIENRRVGEEPVKAALTGGKRLDSYKLYVLSAVQSAHDRSLTVSGFIEKTQKLAKEFDFVYPNLEA